MIKEEDQKRIMDNKHFFQKNNRKGEKYYDKEEEMSKDLRIYI